MELILQVFYSVLSGCLLSAAIPNELFLLGCPFFTLLAFIPFYILFNRAKSYQQAFLLGFIQTLTTHMISSFWLAYFKNFALMTLGASAFGTGCIGGFFGLFFYLPYSSSYNQNKLNENTLHQKLFNTVTFRVIYFAAIYTLYEWVKSCGFLGYPWGTVSSAMFKWPIVMQISAITGTYGITFLIVFFNALAAEGVLYYFDNQKKNYNRFYHLSQTGRFFLVLAAISLFYGFVQYNLPRKARKIITTVMVQQNSDPWKEKTDEASILRSQDLTLQGIKELEEQEKKPELIVWSEGCLKHFFPDAVVHYSMYPEEQPLIPFITKTNIPYIIGGAFVKDRTAKKFCNAALLFDSTGFYRGCYNKNHLVPFAEALPFIEYPKIKNIMAKVIGISAGWTPGDQYVYFEVPCHTTPDYIPPAVKNINLNQTYGQQLIEDAKPVTVKIATPICFDDSFTDIMRPMFNNGAELFINITDDSWSLKKSSELQHFVIASYRSIEYRTTLVRSTNAGYSVILDPAGKIIKDMPLFEADYATFDVPVYDHKTTTYARFGNWLPYIIAILFIAYSVYSYFVFSPYDYIPSERKIKKGKKKSDKKKKKNSKNKK